MGCNKCKEEALLTNVLLDAGYFTQDAQGAFAACLALNLDYTFYDKLKLNSCVYGDRDYCCMVLNHPDSKYVASFSTASDILAKVFGSEYYVRQTKYPTLATDYTIGIVPKGTACNHGDRYHCVYKEKCEITPYYNEFCMFYSFSDFATGTTDLCPKSCTTATTYNEGTLYPWDAVCYHPNSVSCSAFAAGSCGGDLCQPVHECLPITGIRCDPNDECCDERGIHAGEVNPDHPLITCNGPTCTETVECVPNPGFTADSCNSLATVWDCEGEKGKKLGCAWHYTGDSTKYRSGSGYCYNGRSDCYTLDGADCHASAHCIKVHACRKTSLISTDTCEAKPVQWCEHTEGCRIVGQCEPLSDSCSQIKTEEQCKLVGCMYDNDTD